MQRDTASSKFDLTVDALSNLQTAEKKLEEGTIAQKDLTKQQFQTQLNRLGTKTSQNLSDVRRSIEQSQSKTNLAYSGALEEKEKKTEERIREQAMQSSEDLMSAFGMKMGDILGGFEAEKAKLRTEKQRLEYEKSLYSDMSKQRFLGIF
jgi:hypothetical protein